jgi:hypothetical protein
MDPIRRLRDETSMVLEDSIIAGLAKEGWVNQVDNPEGLVNLANIAHQIMLECEEEVRQNPADIRRRSWALRLRAALDYAGVRMDPPRWRSCILAVEDV